VFDLTVPDVSTILADDWDTFVDDPMTVILLVDEEVPVLARLSIRTRQST
jgi:hypothetical protein